MTTLASGTRAALGTNTWHRVALTLQGSTLTAAVDGVTFGSASDGSYAAGPAGLAVGAAELGWKNVQFDNLAITPGAPSQRYKLLNRNSGKALAVNGGATADGATIVQWTDNGTASQQWELGACLTGLNVAHRAVGSHGSRPPSDHDRRRSARVPPRGGSA